MRVRDGGERAGGDDLAVAVQAANDAFTAAMCDDLNVSEALAAVFEFVGAVNKAAPSSDGATAALAAFARFEDVLGVFGDEPKADEGSDAPAELLALLDGFALRLTVDSTRRARQAATGALEALLTGQPATRTSATKTG